MDTWLPFSLLADLVLVLHAAVVFFVIGGLALIVIGNFRHWHWANTLSFRLAHLGAIAFVMAESWLGISCPLTTLEMWLRMQAGYSTYSASFIEHWLQQLLYYTAPHWVFVLGYSVFALLTFAAWIYFPPSVRHRRNQKTY